MERDYLISINGKLEQDGEVDTVNLMTKGRFTSKNGVFFITYEESEATGYGGNTTMVRVDKQDKVSMRRRGSMPSEIVVERGRRRVCHYESGYGSVSFGVSANDIQNGLTEKGGVLTFSYTLDSDRAAYAHNQVEITVREVN